MDKKNNSIVTSDGSHSLYSERFGETYHSKYGAIEETQHIFINAGLKYIKSLNSINIFDFGFGTGLNVLMTYHHYLTHKQKINYYTTEPYHIALEQIQTLNYVEEIYSLHPQININDYKSVYEKLHSCSFNKALSIDNYFSFTKFDSTFEDLKLSNGLQFDLIYFDAFSPEVQPELWTTEIFAKVFSMMKQNSLLVTYCAKGQVKRNLKQAGFTIEPLPGPTGKREITRALKS